MQMLKKFASASRFGTSLRTSTKRTCRFSLLSALRFDRVSHDDLPPQQLHHTLAAPVALPVKVKAPAACEHVSSQTSRFPTQPGVRREGGTNGSNLVGCRAIHTGCISHWWWLQGIFEGIGPILSVRLQSTGTAEVVFERERDALKVRPVPHARVWAVGVPCAPKYVRPNSAKVCVCACVSFALNVCQCAWSMGEADAHMNVRMQAVEEFDEAEVNSVPMYLKLAPVGAPSSSSYHHRIIIVSSSYHHPAIASYHPVIVPIRMLLVLLMLLRDRFAILFMRDIRCAARRLLVSKPRGRERPRERRGDDAPRARARDDDRPRDRDRERARPNGEGERAPADEVREASSDRPRREPRRRRGNLACYSYLRLSPPSCLPSLPCLLPAISALPPLTGRCTHLQEEKAAEKARRRLQRSPRPPIRSIAISSALS